MGFGAVVGFGLSVVNVDAIGNLIPNIEFEISNPSSYYEKNHNPCKYISFCFINY